MLAIQYELLQSDQMLQIQHYAAYRSTMTAVVKLQVLQLCRQQPYVSHSCIIAQMQLGQLPKSANLTQHAVCCYLGWMAHLESYLLQAAQPAECREPSAIAHRFKI